MRTINSIAALALIVTATSCIRSQVHGDERQMSADSLALREVVEELRKDVSNLKDRQQIHDIYVRFARSLDRRDSKMLKSAVWPDAQLNYGTISDSVEAYIEKHVNVDAQIKKHHIITNDSVDVMGDVAHVESYMTELVTDANGKSLIAGARLVDRLDRRNGEWRITVSEWIPYFMTETDTNLGHYIKAETWSRSSCGMGTWDKRDPSYKRPLNVRTNAAVGPPCGE